MLPSFRLATWLYQRALGEPKTTDELFASTEASSAGRGVSFSIPCHERAGEVIKRPEPGSSQRNTLGRQDNRCDLKEEWFPPSGHSSVVGRDDPERLCSLHPSGALVQPGLCNWIILWFYNFSSSFFHGFQHSLTSNLIHIFKHFYVIEKRGK